MKVGTGLVLGAQGLGRPERTLESSRSAGLGPAGLASPPSTPPPSAREQTPQGFRGGVQGRCLLAQVRICVLRTQVYTWAPHQARTRLAYRERRAVPRRGRD